MLQRQRLRLLVEIEMMVVDTSYYWIASWEWMLLISLYIMQRGEEGRRRWHDRASSSSSSATNIQWLLRHHLHLCTRWTTAAEVSLDSSCTHDRVLRWRSRPTTLPSTSPHPVWYTLFNLCTMPILQTKRWWRAEIVTHVRWYHSWALRGLWALWASSIFDFRFWLQMMWKTRR